MGESTPKIRVVGCPGSGKSTLAAELSRRLGLTHIELDALHHLPGWTARPRDEFQALIREKMREADGGWVMDGNYQSKLEGFDDGAKTIIWLDLDKRLVMKRLVLRSLRRAVTREELWNGNRERLRNLFKTEPEENIVLWGWVKHAEYRERYEARMRGAWRGLDIHRLRTPSEVEEFRAGWRAS